MSGTLPDIPRLYTALAEWLACLLYILSQKKRFSLTSTVAISAVMLVAQSLFLVATGDVPIVWWVPCMLVAVGLMLLQFWLSCDTTAAAAGYYCARAFILAEFAASLVWQLYCLFVPAAAPVWASAAFMLPGYAVVLGTVWLLQRRDEATAQHIGGKSLFSATVMALTVFSVSNAGFIQGNTGFAQSDAGTYSNFYVRTLVDLAGVLILTIQQRQLYEANLKLELEALDSTLHHQYEQYQQSRENIRLLNRRYHDLKVQIAAIRAERDPGKQAEYLAEMETGIRRFEAENKTGNAVLDTVLTTKSLHCAQHGINMTVVADGTLLGFMSTMEICTVFGIALDNAIEQVNTLPKEQRLIRVAVYAQNGLVMLRFENYCGNSPAPDEKTDQGIKSIRAVASKYGGTVTAHAEDGWYYLRVLMAPESAPHTARKKNI